MLLSVTGQDNYINTVYFTGCKRGRRFAVRGFESFFLYVLHETRVVHARSANDSDLDFIHKQMCLLLNGIKLNDKGRGF
jgi:hypothetical protein